MEPDVQRFLLSSFDAIEQLETLILLRDDPSKEWNSAEVSAELRRQRRSAARSLEHLRRRGAYRVPVAFATRYGRPGEAKRPGKANNLSSGGIGFETIETFPVGTVLEFALELPTEVLKRAKLAPGGEKTIHGVSVRPFEKLFVKGRIVKADRPKLTVPWTYGIAFLDLDPLAVAELRRYVHLSQLESLNKGIRDPR